MDSKTLVKSLLPPILTDNLKKMMHPNNTGFWGQYNSYESALQSSKGYNFDLILEKTIQATLAVVNGKAKAERDSVLFDEPLYTYPLFAWILREALKHPKLNICDFGGALGSTYYQFKNFVGKSALDFTWSIVELEKTVSAGQRLFQNEQLQFVQNMDTVSAPHILLLSSVLQYLPKPYALFEQMLAYQPELICIERTPFWMGAGDRLTIQRVPPSIYEASYPCWLLDKQKICLLLADNGYTQVLSEIALEGVVTTGRNTCRFENLYYKKTKTSYETVEHTQNDYE